MIQIITLFIVNYSVRASGSKCNQLLNGDALFTLEPISYDDYRLKFEESELVFRFCQPTSSKCYQNATYQDSYAILFHPNNTCTKLTDNKVLFADAFELLNKEEPAEGISIQLMGQYIIKSSGDNNLSVKYIIHCNLDVESSFNIKGVKYNETSMQYVITGDSDAACPLLQISQLWDILERNYIIVSIFTIIIGLAECFYGKRLLQPTLFIVGYLLGFLLSLLIFSEIITMNSNAFYIWIAMMISVLFGAFVGAIAMQLPRIGIVLIGVGLGVVVTLLFWNAVLIHISTSKYLLYTIMIILCAGCAVLSWRVFDHVIILSTSLLGSYLVIRSFSWFIGGFPSELHISQSIYSGQFDEVTSSFYLYLLAILILACLGIRQQYKEWDLGETTLMGLYREKSNDNNEIQGHYVELSDLPESIVQTDKPQDIIGIDDVEHAQQK